MNGSDAGRQEAERFEEAFRLIYLSLRPQAHPELTEHELHLVLHVRVQGGRTLTWLAEHFGLPKSTASVMMKRLEARGFLKRARDPADERRLLIQLGPKGRRLAASYSTLNLESLRDALSALKEGDRRRLVQLVERVAEAASANTQAAMQEPKGWGSRTRGFPNPAALEAERARAATASGTEQSPAIPGQPIPPTSAPD